MKLGDRWWLTMQEHPWARWVGILALIAAMVGLIVAGDFAVTWSCDHGLGFGLANCLPQEQP
jgi:hypothetical protein